METRQNSANRPSRYLTPAEFRQELGLSADTPASIVRNPRTNKLFVDIAGKRFKIKQSADTSKPMQFVIWDSFEEGCFMNIASNNVVATF